MTGRGIDQALPHPSPPVLYESYVASAKEYVAMAEKRNGPIPKPAGFPYIWGDALTEMDRVAPAARIVNLETSITTSADYEPKGINYRMHPANTPCLTAARIHCCALANNHVLDWGRPGLSDTLAALHSAGIQTAGAGRNLAEAETPAILSVPGANSRVLVFSAGTSDCGILPGWAATDTRSGVALLRDLTHDTADRISQRVEAAKRPGDLAVLSLHWGGNWGYPVPPAHRGFAHRLIDAGAVDVIHGHSSHHPKAIEIYRGKLILYGCGDFLSDYEGISGYEAYRSHLVLLYFLTIDPSTRELLQLRMTPFETKRFRLQRASPRDAAWLAETLSREGESFHTRVRLDADARLTLQWRGFQGREKPGRENQGKEEP